MNLDDQVNFHEQWLRSIDSNLGRVTDDLARVSNNLDRVTNDLAEITSRLNRLTAVTLSLAERQEQSEARIQRLEELFERWLRSQRDGHN